jgi:sugar transferase (PEP-CTERM/EpsH1 system associated)
MRTPPEHYEQFCSDARMSEVFRSSHFLAPPAMPTLVNRIRHRLHHLPHFEKRISSPGFFSQARASVAEIVRTASINRIVTEGIEMVQFVPNVAVPLLVDLCDCASLLARQRAQKQPSVLTRLHYRLEARGIARLERAVAGRADLVTLITAEDEIALLSNSQTARTLVVPNGVDTDYFAPDTDESPAPDLVFTGVMNYEPNADAAIYLIREILPRVHEQRPATQLWVVGSQPTPELRELGNRPGVNVTGEVGDVRPFVRRSAIFVCPLRWGAGMKNKLLAAMAMEKPVVATSCSLNGIDVRPNKDVLVGDSPDQFAAQILQLFSDPELARNLGARGREFVLSNHSWQNCGAILENALVNLALTANS